jgi:hypothetical protein
MGDSARDVGAAAIPPGFDAGDPAARTILAPRHDLACSVIADKALVLDRAHARAHLLNVSAAWVWDLIDGTRTVRDVAVIVAAELDVDLAVVLGDIERTIASFEVAGLLGGGPAPVASAPAGSLPSSGVARDLSPDLGGPFEAIGMVFGVTADPGELAPAIEPLLEPLRRGAADPVRGIAYSIREVMDHRLGHVAFEVRVGDDVLVRVGDVPSAIDQLLVEINRRAIAAATGRLVFHAGAVEVSGRGVILPAVSGSGKSTLTAGLVAAGAGYGTDEAAVIEPSTLLIEPYRKPLSLSAASIDALDQWHIGPGPEIVDWPVSAGVKHHVAPERLGRSMTAPVPLAAIVFPRYVDDGPTVIEPLGVEDALVALVPCTFAATWEVDDALAHVVAMVESTPAYRLEVGDLGEAVRLVCEVAAEVGGGVP